MICHNTHIYMGEEEISHIIEPLLSRAGEASGKHFTFIFLLLKSLDARSDSLSQRHRKQPLVGIFTTAMYNFIEVTGSLKPGLHSLSL